MERVGLFYIKLGEKIKTLRINKRITQEQMAKKLKVSRTCYANWEQATRRIDIDTMIKICDILGCDINDLSNDLRKYLESYEH